MATDVKNDPDLATSLVAYYELEEASGTRIDSHTNGYDLSEFNSVTQQSPAIVGNGASFNRANSEYLRSTNSGLQITSDISFAAWIYPQSASARLLLWNTFTVSGGVRGLITSLEKSGSNFVFRFANYVSGSGKDANFNSATFTVNTWAHLAFSYDISAGEVKVYKNGSLVETQTGFRTSITTLTNSYFGIDDNLGSVNFYNGDLDEMALWSKVITAAEITDLYNSGSGIPYDAGGGGGGGAAQTARRGAVMMM